MSISKDHIPKRALIIDDQSTICKIYSKILTAIGVPNIDVEISGNDGLKKFESAKYDVVLLDIKLPDINGLSVLEKMKKIDPAAHIIMLTSISEKTTVVESLNKGATSYILKTEETNHAKAKLLAIFHKIEFQKIPDTALIIDDQETMCSIYSKLLKSIGVPSIHIETSGKKGLLYYQQHKPNVVLLDIQMPDIDGIKILSALKKIDPDSNVVMLTSVSEKNTVIDVMNKGANSYILKTENIDILKNKLFEIFNKLEFVNHQSDENRRIQRQNINLMEES